MRTIFVALVAIFASVTVVSAETVFLRIETDALSNETSWQFETAGGVTVASGPDTDYPGETTVTETLDLDPGDYTFTMLDSFGDGICCDVGNGTWFLSFQGTTITSPSNGEFGLSESVDFTIAEPADTTPPTATTASLASDNADPTLATNNDIVTLDMVFDEPLAGAPTVSILGQAVIATGSGTSWTASLLISGATAEGPVGFSISDFEDAAGNTGGPVSATTDGSSITVDATAPTVAISGAPAQVTSDPFDVTVTFSEAVSGFELADMSVGNGSATGISGSGDTYTVEITPDGNGDVTLDVAAAVAQDAAGNDNEAATGVLIPVDTVPPTLVISGVPDALRSCLGVGGNLRAA
ncbi:hypothetical protein DZD18_14085 [Rhodobacteraceae bacterium W635]|uniref:Ig-like domain-containing protein n=1 Tax=Nioella halotolerans TaxID=2303578 RepID=UPI000E3B5D89|nr:hypothetical protein DZD18_14085 [Rhodobacteraceae bacterium W635]